MKYEYFKPEVKLVGYTQLDQDFYAKEDIKNLQDFIAFCAKVSNPKHQMNLESAERLISYLVKHQHWSPFEMVDAVLEIDVTRDIGRQILRHVSFRFQEFSQRYADVNDNMSFCLREARLQDHKNRQNSIETENFDAHYHWKRIQEEILEQSIKGYTFAVNELGIAKEQARAILPEGLTMSRMYVKGSIRSWIHYVSLRGGNGTQKEHIEVALACAKAISKVFPMIEEFVPKQQVKFIATDPSTAYFNNMDSFFPKGEERESRSTHIISLPKHKRTWSEFFEMLGKQRIKRGFTLWQ